MTLTRRTAMAGLLLLPAAARAQDARPLRIGDQRGGIQPLMQAAGLLRGLPFDLQWSRFASAPTLLEALNAGAIDAGSIGDAPFAAAVEAGVDMKAVSATRADAAVTAVVVPAGSTIREVADLKGRRIATLRGQTGHFLVLAALERARLSPSDVHFVFLGPADAKVAMASGVVDAWATWGPYISMAKLVDGAREIVNGRGLMTGQSYTVASTSAIVERRRQLSEFLKRARQAREWGLANPNEQARIWSEQTGFPPEVGVDVVRTAQTRTVPIDNDVVAAQQQVADFFHANGVLERLQQVERHVDRSFNDAIFAA